MSMSTVESQMRAAILAAFPGYQIEVENETLVNRQPGKWGQLYFRPGKPLSVTIGSGGLDRVDGLNQLTFHYQRATGTDEALADFEILRAAFFGGRALFSGDTSIYIKNTSYDVGSSSGVWYTVHLSVFWFATIAR